MANDLYNIPKCTLASSPGEGSPRPVSLVKGSLMSKTGVPSKSGKATYSTPQVRKVPLAQGEGKKWTK